MMFLELKIERGNSKHWKKCEFCIFNLPYSVHILMTEKFYKENKVYTLCCFLIFITQAYNSKIKTLLSVKFLK